MHASSTSMLQHCWLEWQHSSTRTTVGCITLQHAQPSVRTTACHLRHSPLPSHPSHDTWAPSILQVLAYYGFVNFNWRSVGGAVVRQLDLNADG